MMVWMPLTYVMGNFVPQYFVPGAGGAAVTGLYIHDLGGPHGHAARLGHDVLLRAASC